MLSLTVSVVLLFLPEVYGIASHVLYPRATVIGSYQVRIPRSWFIEGVERAPARSIAYGFAATGLAREPHRYLLATRFPAGMPLASWAFRDDHLKPERYPRDPSKREQIEVAGTTLTCLTYPSYFDMGVVVDCSSDAGLHAYLRGDESLVPEFYRTLRNITRVSR